MNVLILSPAARRFVPLTVLIGHFLVGICSGQELKAGNYRVGWDEAGALSLKFGKVTVFDREQLQLVNLSSGWESVFGYGKTGKPGISRDDSSVRFSEEFEGVLGYTKTVSVTPDGVHLDLEWQIQPGAGAEQNYYFLNIPESTLSRGLYRITTRAGRTVRGTMRQLQGPVAGLAGALFTTPSCRIEFEFSTENVKWQLTDWTASVHRSWRLRIEQSAREPGDAAASVHIRATACSMEEFEHLASEFVREEERMKRQRMMDWGMISDRPLAIGTMIPESDTVFRGEKFELTFDLSASYDNPFDPDQIDVTCAFLCPDGKRVTVPAFFWTPFSEGDRGGPDRRGDSAWKVRFSPRVPGTYEYTITASDRNGTVSSGPGEFEAEENDYAGFVRVSAKNPTIYEFDNGEAYLPIGVNIFHWARLGEALPPERLALCSGWMGNLAESGGNFIRLRVDSWWNAIEGTADTKAGYLGPGWYLQKACWEIDRIYELAEKRGLQVMHCLYNANGLVNPSVSGRGRNAWRRAYAFCLKENGGTCEHPDEFWTDGEMRRLTRRKLRYSVARWGYSRNLMCWEFWNELKPRESVLDEQVSWHRDMSRYLRKTDPYNHPITNSLAGKDLEIQDRFWKLPEMDITQVHIYKGKPLPVDAANTVRDFVTRWQKPFFLGEYGVIHADHSQGRYPYDPHGVHLHNGLWAPLMAGGSGAGAFWFVSSYIEPRDLYFHYRALSAWAGKVPWNHPEMTELQVGGISPVGRESGFPCVDGFVPTAGKNPFSRAQEDRFFIDPVTGAVENGEWLQPMLHAGETRKSCPTLVLDCREPSVLEVNVTSSVGDSTNELRIFLDGKPFLQKPFPAGEEFGTSSEYIEQYDNWITQYGNTVTVRLAPGEHEVKLEAVGKDRLEVEYRLRNYFRFPPVVLIGRRIRSAAWFWMRDRHSTALNLRDKVSLAPVPSVNVTLSGLEDGLYYLEWWDTWKGETLGTTRARCDAGQLTFAVPGFKYDIAGRCGLVEE